jgi:iron complex transport system substrate-binding protein
MPSLAFALIVALIVALAPARATPAAPEPQRIVSLVPSTTEDLFALGLGARVVGVSAYSTFPPAAKRLPVISDYSRIDVERILALHADLAIGISSQSRFAADLQRAHVPVVLFPDDTLHDVDAGLRAIGARTGSAARAESLIRALHARTAALVRGRAQHRRVPSVFVVLGTAPITSLGPQSYIAQLIGLAGGRDSAHLRSAYGEYSPEQLLIDQPDALVVDPSVTFDTLRTTAPWNSLRAVRDHHVFVLSNPDVLLRPGPRYNEGLAWLIARLRELPA